MNDIKAEIAEITEITETAEINYEVPMSESGLKENCPFCGLNPISDEKFFILSPATHWTGMRSILINWTLRHWCQDPELRIQVTRPTLVQLAEKWNKRK